MADTALILRSSGNDFSLWRDKLVEKSMLTPLHTFYFSVSDVMSGSVKDFKLGLDTECDVVLQDKVILTGIVEDLRVNRGMGTSSVQVSGREIIAAAWESYYQESTYQWKDQSILNNIKNLLKGFSDISVSADSDVTSDLSATVPVFTASPLLPIGDQVLRLCGWAGVLPLSKGDGKLYLTRGTTKDFCTDSIEMGNNALESEFFVSNRHRYSDTRTIGQGRGEDDRSLTSFTQARGEFRDSQVRDKYLTGFFDGDADAELCRTVSRWRGRIAAGMSRAVTYRVAGWTESNDKPWEINKLVRVSDETMEIQETRLIVSVEYFLHKRSAPMTDITVVPKDTFSLSSSGVNVKMTGIN